MANGGGGVVSGDRQIEREIEARKRTEQGVGVWSFFVKNEMPAIREWVWGV